MIANGAAVLLQLVAGRRLAAVLRFRTELVRQFAAAVRGGSSQAALADPAVPTKRQARSAASDLTALWHGSVDGRRRSACGRRPHAYRTHCQRTGSSPTGVRSDPSAPRSVSQHAWGGDAAPWQSLPCCWYPHGAGCHAVLDVDTRM